MQSRGSSYSSKSPRFNSSTPSPSSGLTHPPVVRSAIGCRRGGPRRGCCCLPPAARQEARASALGGTQIRARRRYARLAVGWRRQSRRRPLCASCAISNTSFGVPVAQRCAASARLPSSCARTASPSTAELCSLRRDFTAGQSSMAFTCRSPSPRRSWE
jgi:hypothetical protein